MCNVSGTKRQDFSSYLLIRNNMQFSNSVLSRNELRDEMLSFSKLMKFRFQENFGDGWEAAFAQFVDVSAAKLAIRFLETKGSIMVDFMPSLFDLYDDMETKIKPICDTPSVIVVETRNLNMTSLEIKTYFERYGEICDITVGEVWRISYKCFSHCLAAEMDNNKWENCDSYFIVRTLKSFKEYILGFFVVIDDYSIDNVSRPTEVCLEYPHVPLPEGPSVPYEQSLVFGNVTDDLIKVLRTKLISNSTSFKNITSTLPFNGMGYKFYLMVTRNPNQDLILPEQATDDSNQSIAEYCSVTQLTIDESKCIPTTRIISAGETLNASERVEPEIGSVETSDVGHLIASEFITSETPDQTIHMIEPELAAAETLNVSHRTEQELATMEIFRFSNEQNLPSSPFLPSENSALNESFHYDSHSNGSNVARDDHGEFSSYGNSIISINSPTNRPIVRHEMVAENFNRYAQKNHFLPHLKVSNSPISYASRTSLHCSNSGKQVIVQKKSSQPIVHTTSTTPKLNRSPVLNEENFPPLQQSSTTTISRSKRSKTRKTKYSTKPCRQVSSSEYIESVFHFPKYRKNTNPRSNYWGKCRDTDHRVKT